MKFKNMSKLIKRRREALDLSQKDLGDAVGCHLQFISNIERGVCGIPTPKVPIFSKVLKLPIRTFVDTAIKDFKSKYINDLDI